MNFIYSIYFYNSAPHFYCTFTIYEKKNIIFCFTIFFGELSNLSYKLDVKPAAEEDAIHSQMEATSCHHLYKREYEEKHRYQPP